MKNNNLKISSKLILFEGIDGAGKTAICIELKKKLEFFKKRVLILKEPCNCEIYNFIKREKLKLNFKDQFFLFASCSRINNHNIKKELLFYDYILLDRSLISSFVYQLDKILTPSLDSKNFFFLWKRFFLPLPKFVFFINTNYNLAYKRIQNRFFNLTETNKKKIDLEDLKYSLLDLKKLQLSYQKFFFKTNTLFSNLGIKIIILNINCSISLLTIIEIILQKINIFV